MHCDVLHVMYSTAPHPTDLVICLALLRVAEGFVGRRDVFETLLGKLLLGRVSIWVPFPVIWRY